MYFSPNYEQLNDAGFKIVNGILSEEELKLVRDAILKESTDLIFSRQGFKVDPEKSSKLFFDQKLREEQLGESAKRCVWRDGNTRQPLIGKTTGMVHMHFDPIVLENIIFNEKLYKVSAEINNCKSLVFRSGPERVSIKGKGTTRMDKHIDANLFYPRVNYPFRIQSLVVLDIDIDIEATKNGSLTILPYFHHYWDFAGALFHPKTGFFNCKFPENTSRFFKLPTGKKSFDKFYLPRFKKFARAYAEYLEGVLDFRKTFGVGATKHRGFFELCKSKGIVVPSNSLGYIENMNWLSLPLRRGSIAFWHQHLPHFSQPNKSEKPRVVAYCNLFPVTKEWWNSPEQQWVKRQFERCEFYYGIDYRRYPTTIANKEEHQRLVDEGRIEEVASISQKDSFRKKLSGQENWF